MSAGVPAPTTRPAGGVGKRAADTAHLARPTLPFPNARTAFAAILNALDLAPGDEVLLPAYIGWSKNEGSGVFDPVVAAGVGVRFYRVGRDLAIDLADLRAQLATGRPRLLLVIHFFGWPDPRLAAVVAAARAAGALVVEDEAHALYSDWVGGVCGRAGDVAIFSLHKMLPAPAGGLLVVNPSLAGRLLERLRGSPLQAPLAVAPLDYDLLAIAAARRANAQALLDLLAPLGGRADPLYPTLATGVVPQTLPVLIRERSRDALYDALNARGYGVVSLYHTLVAPITVAAFPDSHWLARHILNLPVHQDVAPGAPARLVAQLGELL